MGRGSGGRLGFPLDSDMPTPIRTLAACGSALSILILKPRRRVAVSGSRGRANAPAAAFPFGDCDEWFFLTEITADGLALATRRRGRSAYGRGAKSHGRIYKRLIRQGTRWPTGSELIHFQGGAHEKEQGTLHSWLRSLFAETCG